MSEKAEKTGDRETAESPRSLLQRIGALRKRMGKGIRFLVTNTIDPEDAIHPDFRLCERVDSDLTWYWNRESGGLRRKPPFKISFFMNDPKLLDHCPWVCKFGKNLNDHHPDFPYICFAYGDSAKEDFGLEDMKKWAMQFDHPCLMTFGGETIEMLNGDDPIPPPTVEPARKVRLRDLL